MHLLRRIGKTKVETLFSFILVFTLTQFCSPKPEKRDIKRLTEFWLVSRFPTTYKRRPSQEPLAKLTKILKNGKNSGISNSKVIKLLLVLTQAWTNSFLWSLFPYMVFGDKKPGTDFSTMKFSTEITLLKLKFLNGVPEVTNSLT
jgi:hypothetical protein